MAKSSAWTISTKNVIERELLILHPPRRFRCSKRAVVTSTTPNSQVGLLDSAGSALLYDEAHSIFAIDAVLSIHFKWM